MQPTNTDLPVDNGDHRTEEEIFDELPGDDLMPNSNDGNIFAAPEQEDVEEEKAEDEQLINGTPGPMMDALFEWLDNEMKDCDSVQATLGIAKEYGVTMENAMAAMDVCRKVFEAKKVSLENLRDTLNGKKA